MCKLLWLNPVMAFFCLFVAGYIGLHNHDYPAAIGELCLSIYWTTCWYRSLKR